MDAAWDFYFTHDGQAALLVALDLAWGEGAPHAHLPERLIVSTQMRTPLASGLRSPGEAPALRAVEDAIAAVLQPAGWVRVGRVVTRGRTDFIYHGPVGDRPALPEGDYPLKAIAHSDASWDLYRNFLWPGVREWQQMQNRRGLMQLKAQGDAGEAPRPISHSVRALDREAALAAGKALVAAGFTPGSMEELEDEWTVRFTGVAPPAQIDAITAEIFELVDALGDVVYLGWTCGVVTG